MVLFYSNATRKQSRTVFGCLRRFILNRPASDQAEACRPERNYDTSRGRQRRSNTAEDARFDGFVLCVADELCLQHLFGLLKSRNR